MLSLPTVLDGVRRNHKGKQCDGGGEGDSVRVSSFLCSETFSVMEWEGGKRENRSVGHTTNPGMQILKIHLIRRKNKGRNYTGVHFMVRSGFRKCNVKKLHFPA